VLARAALISAAIACVVGSASIQGASATPASGQIVFVTNRAHNLWRYAVYSIAPDGKRHRRVGLGVPTTTGSDPLLTPDGRKILLSQNVVRIAGVSGRGLRVVVPEEIYVANGSISPNGRRLAFTGTADRTCDYDCEYSVYMIDLDGRHLRRVGSGRDPSWAPDSRALVFSSQGSAPELLVRTSRGAIKRIGVGSRPLWAPRGTRIAYSPREGAPYCFVDSDGSNKRCAGERPAGQGAWSPDGTRFAYSSRGLVLARGNGRVIRRLTWQGQDEIAAWSPDSKALAFVRINWNDEEHPRSEIRVQPVDRVGRSRLIRTEPFGVVLKDAVWHPGRIVYIAPMQASDLELALMKPGSRGVRILTRNDLDEREPDWSPDRRTIVFVQEWKAYPFGGSNLRLVQADGSRNRVLTSRGPYSDRLPSWSPDGRTIAFLRDRHDAPGASVVLRDVRRGSMTVLATPARPQGRVSWAPDSQEVVFGGLGSFDAHGLYAVRVDGSGWRRIATDCSSSSSPELSPQGTHIAFVGQCNGFGYGFGVFLIQIDGSGLRRLTETPLRPPGSWSPDGTKLVFAGAEQVDHGVNLSTVEVSDGTSTPITRSLSWNFEPAWSR
jgi:Tol biopolymer transport system component